MANDNYGTPNWLMKVFENWFDPCPINAVFDGLNIRWEMKTYVNPPYSNPLPWVEKAIEESKKGKTIVMLLKADTSTKYYARLLESKARILFFSGRIKFAGQKNTATFPSMLCILGTKEVRKR
ncbi:hypothetical protein LCGC14_0476380 [marine sediment metagenome]|uniref:Phage N-6-adenine-methyltransferase n=1 Tax=marine sediment metagenome TaxID=412755 RepID=A0A0F9SAL0_9ZZZZ